MYQTHTSTHTLTHSLTDSLIHTHKHTQTHTHKDEGSPPVLSVLVRSVFLCVSLFLPFVDLGVERVLPLPALLLSSSQPLDWPGLGWAQLSHWGRATQNHTQHLPLHCD